jgi:hypothetical protein
MRLLVFTVVALMAMVTCYTVFGWGGPVCALVFLFIVFNGVLDRFAQPLIAKLKA